MKFTYKSKKETDKERDLIFWARLTDDICQYYGVLNFASPQYIEAEQLENYITQ